MPQSDSDSDSGWNKELIAAVSKKQGKTKTISEEDRIKQIQECLDEDADIDTVDENGNTALHTAVKRGYQTVAEFLRKAGARTDIPNRNGQTAISLARDLGKQEIVCTLNEPSTSRDSDLSSHNPSLNASLYSTIRKRTAATQDSRFDGSLRKMRLMNTSQADPQRDVVSDEQRSNRKRTADDELVEHTKRLRKMTLTAEKEKYRASGLKRSLHGTVYQLKHLMLIMHRARELNYSFRLATEMDTAEKFDDVVLHYKDSDGDERYRFIQVKHKQDENKAISAKDLSNYKDGDFSLLKYFVSWRKIEGNPTFAGVKSKDLILCTNIGLKVDDLKKSNISVVEETGTDNLLSLRNVTNREKQPKQSRRYKLVIENSSTMWKTLKTRSGGKVTDDEILRFLDEFILAVNQHNEIELSEIIEREIGAEFNQLDAGIVRDSFQIEILDWFKTKDGTFLTDVDADEFFDEMKGKLAAIKTMAVGLDHMEKLEELGIRFNGVNTMIQKFISGPTDGSKQLLELISPKQTLLTALRVCQTLAQRKKLCKNEIFTFVRLKTLSRQKISQLVLRAFEWSADRNLLIVDCESVSAEQYLQSLWNPICDIMAKDVDKKMILITQAGKDLGSECHLDRETCRVDNTGHGFENLTNESQKKLLAKQVTKFQGTNNSTNLAELLDIPDWDNLRVDELNDLSNIMDPDSLVKLISEHELQIGRELDGLENVGDYYVNRTILQHVVIKEDILKDTELPDLFVVSGIDGILSGEMMQIEGTADMDSTLGVERCIPEELLQIRGPSSTAQIPTNFITLARNREEEQFNALCAKNEGRNVHWLRKEEGKYVWNKSQGNITSLVQYRDDGENIDINKKTRVTNLDEDQLTVHNEPVIISDTAGMGKSTMLTHLASQVKENEPDMLVLKINLNHHSTALADVMKKPSYDLGSIDGAIQFLVKELLSGETNFSRKVFKRIIERNHKVALIFDGFDEISPTYEKTVIDILQTLADYGIRKLLVATRPHTRESLEAKLNAFSFEIRPFSRYDQERFLTSFWRTKFEDSHHELNPTAEDRIRKYTVAILKTLADSIKDQRNKFTAIPLQAKLVAEVFERNNEGVRKNFDSCKDFIESEDEEPKFQEKINLIYLYEHFVGKKFEIFFKKRGGNLADVAVLEDKVLRYESYIAKHETLALDTLFDKDQIGELLLSQLNLNYELHDSTHPEIPIERDGIITQFIDGQPQFGHRTYAEYFAAKFFSKILKKREADESLGKILVAHVLLEDKYETMRAFMNWLLSDEYDDVLEGEVWTRFVKEYRSQKKETIFHLAAAEGNDHIVRIFLNCFGANNEDRKVIIHVRDFDGRTAVHRAVEYGHLDKIKLLVENTDFEINCQDARGSTPLHRAAQVSPLDVVKYLIDKGADVDSRNTSGLTPLHAVANKGEFGIVDYLLKNGANVDLPTNDGETPLLSAARRGSLRMVEHLRKKGANINSRNDTGWMSIHVAAGEGDLELVDYLLEKGLDVNLTTDFDETPLHHAVQCDHLEMVQYLLEKGATINSHRHDGWTPLHLAANEGYLEIVDHFLGTGIDVNLPTNDGQTPLYTAAQGGQLEMVKYLLEKGANINSQDDDAWMPIHVAAYRGRLAVVDYFIEKGLDINLPTNDGETPLYTAAEGGQLEMVKHLLEKGANINSQHDDGWMPLHVAAYRGELAVVDYFIEKGLDINLPTNDGETLLYLAIQGGQADVVIYLLDRGAKMNTRCSNLSLLSDRDARVSRTAVMSHLFDKAVDFMSQSSDDGWTLLHAAAFAGKSKMVRYLLDNGANVNSESNDGWTPLHAVAQEGKLDIVKYLLDMTADVNFKTNEGWTPLHTAVIAGQYDVMKYLLDNGGDVNSQTNDGWTTLDIASEMGEEDIVKYLHEMGAASNSQPTEGQ